MPLDLRTIFEIEDPLAYKLHAARFNGEKNPLDVFLSDQSEWVKWNSWYDTKNVFNRRYIFSFIDFYPERHVWLFGGIFEVLSRGFHYGPSYEIKELGKFSNLVGRLKIKFDFPRGRSFRLENIIDRAEIVEVLPARYTGEPFPGLENISVNFKALESYILSERPDWKTPLQSVKGIYVIVDRKTGRKYVGSAYGEIGIWSRWQTYIANGHGHNRQLEDLIGINGLEYAREYFRITLVESHPFRTIDKIIIDRETFWKNALLTRGDFGYNSN